MKVSLGRTLAGRAAASRHMLLRASALALLAIGGTAALPPLADGHFDAAWAQSHGGGGQGGGGQGGGGHSGGSGGHDDGGHDDGGHDDDGHASGGKGKGPFAGQSGAGGGGQGQGGPDAGSDGRGPQYGKSGQTTGGRPVWAQEGIPEVELGRLNVVRSPDHVLQRAYDEALANLTPEMVSFYSMSLDQAITELSLNFDSQTYIDSPLQNLALLKDALDGSSVLTSLGVKNSVGTLEAMFLGVASDKNLPVTPESVLAVTTILGYNLTLPQATALATDAEAVRIAVLAGHG